MLPFEQMACISEMFRRLTRQCVVFNQGWADLGLIIGEGALAEADHLQLAEHEADVSIAALHQRMQRALIHLQPLLLADLHQPLADLLRCWFPAHMNVHALSSTLVLQQTSANLPVLCLTDKIGICMYIKQSMSGKEKEDAHLKSSSRQWLRRDFSFWLYLSLQMQMMGSFAVFMVWMRSATPPLSPADMPSTSSMIRHSCTHSLQLSASCNKAPLAYLPWRCIGGENGESKQ